MRCTSCGDRRVTNAVVSCQKASGKMGREATASLHHPPVEVSTDIPSDPFGMRGFLVCTRNPKPETGRDEVGANLCLHFDAASPAPVMMVLRFVRRVARGFRVESPKKWTRCTVPTGGTPPMSFRAGTILMRRRSHAPSITVPASCEGLAGFWFGSKPDFCVVAGLDQEPKGG